MSRLEKKHPEIPANKTGKPDVVFYRELRRHLLTIQSDPSHKPSMLIKWHERVLMRKINEVLYELTGNDMYLWLCGSLDRIEKIKNASTDAGLKKKENLLAGGRDR
jgi:hypothetical protein